MRDCGSPARARQFRQQHRPVIGLAAQHHAVGPAQLANYLRRRAQAAVEHHRHRRDARLELAHHVVTQRRNLAIVAGDQAPSTALRACTMTASQPAATMPSTNSSSAARSAVRSGRPRRAPFPVATRPRPELARIDDADAQLHGHRDRHGIAHGGHALGDQRGLSIRQAPKAPECTRSLGQPQLRLISS